MIIPSGQVMVRNKPGQSSTAEPLLCGSRSGTGLLQFRYRRRPAQTTRQGRRNKFLPFSGGVCNTTKVK
jgi:hypothetical protein